MQRLASPSIPALAGKLSIYYSTVDAFYLCFIVVKPLRLDM
jgi:hypothetical protein